MRAPEKAAEAEHGRPEDGGGREDGRRRQPRRGHQVKLPARSLFTPVQRDPLDVLPRARICLPRASLLPSKRQPRLEQGTERRRAPQPGRGRERGWDCAWAGTCSAPLLLGTVWCQSALWGWDGRWGQGDTAEGGTARSLSTEVVAGGQQGLGVRAPSRCTKPQPGARTPTPPPRCDPEGCPTLQVPCEVPRPRAPRGCPHLLRKAR